MNNSAVWPSVHVPVNNKSMKSPCINMASAEAVGVGEGIKSGECTFVCMCVYLWPENGFLHCRCNNLRPKGAGGGSSITISSPPSVSLSAK